MYTREVTDTEMIDDDATLYENMDEDEMLHDDYWDGEEDYESSHDDYSVEDETDYYSNGYDTTTAEATYMPADEYIMPLSARSGLTFWIFAELLIVILLGLRCIEKGNKTAKAMAIVGLITGLFSAILQLLAAWQVFSLTDSDGLSSLGVPLMVRIMLNVTLTTAVAIICAMIMRIRESEMMVKILKWVAIGCGLVSWLLIVILLFLDDGHLLGKVMGVSSITQSCGLISWIVAFMMSKFGKSEALSNAKPIAVEEVNMGDTESKPESEHKLEPEPRLEPKPEPGPAQETNV